MSSPYRTASRLKSRASRPHPDGDLLPVFGLLWLVSVAHVTGVLERGSSFGTEDTLALLSIFLLPVLVKEPLLGLVRGRQRSR